MTGAQQKAAAKLFVKGVGRGHEKVDSQPF